MARAESKESGPGDGPKSRSIAKKHLEYGGYDPEGQGRIDGSGDGVRGQGGSLGPDRHGVSSSGRGGGVPVTLPDRRPCNPLHVLPNRAAVNGKLDLRHRVRVEDQGPDGVVGPSGDFIGVRIGVAPQTLVHCWVELKMKKATRIGTMAKIRIALMR